MRHLRRVAFSLCSLQLAVAQADWQPLDPNRAKLLLLARMQPRSDDAVRVHYTLEEVAAEKGAQAERVLRRRRWTLWGNREAWEARLELLDLGSGAVDRVKIYAGGKVYRVDRDASGWMASVALGPVEHDRQCPIQSALRPIEGKSWTKALQVHAPCDARRSPDGEQIAVFMPLTAELGSHLQAGKFVSGFVCHMAVIASEAYAVRLARLESLEAFGEGGLVANPRGLPGEAKIVVCGHQETQVVSTGWFSDQVSIGALLVPTKASWSGSRGTIVVRVVPGSLQELSSRERHFEFHPPTDFGPKGTLRLEDGSVQYFGIEGMGRDEALQRLVAQGQLLEGSRTRGSGARWWLWGALACVAIALLLWIWPRPRATSAP